MHIILYIQKRDRHYKFTLDLKKRTLRRFIRIPFTAIAVFFSNQWSVTCDIFIYYSRTRLHPGFFRRKLCRKYVTIQSYRNNIENILCSRNKQQELLIYRENHNICMYYYNVIAFRLRFSFMYNIMILLHLSKILHSDICFVIRIHFEPETQQQWITTTSIFICCKVVLK